MKTLLITGGASGLGKALALRYLAKGDRVIAVGSSSANGETLRNEAKQLDAADRAVFLKADLSLISENRRIVSEIQIAFPALDALVFCASRHCKAYSETSEGIEFSFALDYLSRFILGYELKECLERTDNPIIVNVCGTGMNGDVNWNDLYHKNDFIPMKVMMHNSRLNDLCGVEFVGMDNIGKIKYLLYNPMAVRTPGMNEFSNTVMKLYYRLAAKPVDKAALLIANLIDNQPISSITACKEHKKLSLDLPSFNKDNARRLYDVTRGIVANVDRV